MSVFYMLLCRLTVQTDSCFCEVIHSVLSVQKGSCLRGFDSLTCLFYSPFGKLGKVTVLVFPYLSSIRVPCIPAFPLEAERNTVIYLTVVYLIAPNFTGMRNSTALKTKCKKLRKQWYLLCTFSASCWATSLSSWIFFCLSMETSGFPWACASRSLAICSFRLTLWYARLALSSCRKVSG